MEKGDETAALGKREAKKLKDREVWRVERGGRVADTCVGRRVTAASRHRT